MYDVISINNNKKCSRWQSAIVQEEYNTLGCARKITNFKSDYSNSSDKNSNFASNHSTPTHYTLPAPYGFMFLTQDIQLML